MTVDHCEFCDLSPIWRFSHDSYVRLSCASCVNRMYVLIWLDLGNVTTAVEAIGEVKS